MEKQYVAIDLKSFFASVECVERGLDPLDTNLVVADKSRTEKTICLAVTPSLKQYGLSGRSRLFEVVQRVREINSERLYRHRLALHNFKAEFSGESCSDRRLKEDGGLSLSYITAPPRMAKYMEYSTRIYEIYLRHVAPEDITAYSIDEVFMDVTPYLNACGMTAREFASNMINEVFSETGITATAGIGTNLYLCKAAMDIVAKKMKPDKNGVRIAELDEMTYRKLLWEHRPLTDFWRVGQGYSKKLEQYGMYTMGDVARCSIDSEKLLYKLFGVNAELLIDHAWGYEPCTLSEIKSYRPAACSLSRGQVLSCPYEYEKARLIVREMADVLSFELVGKGLVTDQLVLNLGYDAENLKNGNSSYTGEVTLDRYGRKIPKHAAGTINIGKYTSSYVKMSEMITELFDRIADPDLLVRRINITANHVISENEGLESCFAQQLDFFSDAAEQELADEREKRERNMQKAILKMKEKYGGNAVIKGMNLEEGSTAISRNKQIGGHSA